MVYKVRCIMPDERTMMIEDKVVAATITCEEDYKCDTIEVLNMDGSLQTFTCDELGERFHFEYTKRLLFLHEKDLRDSIFLVDNDVEQSKENRQYFEKDLLLKTKLDSGFCHPAARAVRYVNKEVGFGLFATESIESGTFIGEYVGVVKRVSTNEERGPSSAYSANYGQDGSTEINAYEFGNIIRFLNHSDTPNCAFRKVTIGKDCRPSLLYCTLTVIPLSF